MTTSWTKTSGICLLSPLSKLKSAITGGSAQRKTKGRGFREEADADRDARLSSRDFDSLDADGGPGALRWKIGELCQRWESRAKEIQRKQGAYQGGSPGQNRKGVEPEFKGKDLGPSCRERVVLLVGEEAGNIFNNLPNGLSVQRWWRE